MSREFIPREYQERIIQKIVDSPRHGVFIEPGLGKSAIALEAFRRLKAKNIVPRMLIVTPLSPLYHTWTREIQKWKQFNHFKVAILHGPNKLAEIVRNDADIFLINPEGIQWYYEQLIHGVVPPFINTLVIDESTRFKNPRAARTKYITALAELFERRYIMTGYPTPNGYLDLYSQIYLLDKGEALGRNFTVFQRRYFDLIDQGHAKYFKPILKDHMLEKINEAIRPLVSQLSVEDVMKLPKLHHVPIVLEPTDKFKRAYRTLETQLVVEIENVKTAFALTSATSLMKCRQYVNGFVYDEDGIAIDTNKEKLKALKEFISELGGKPVLIFYVFKEDGRRIMESLETPNKAQVYGGMSQKQKVRIFDQWNSGYLDALVCQPNTMAHGANIQAGGSIIIWYSLLFDYELYYQGFRRLYRSGQVKPTYNYYLLMSDTVDLDIYRAIRGKKHKVYQSFIRFFKERAQIDQKMYN